MDISTVDAWAVKDGIIFDFTFDPGWESASFETLCEMLRAQSAIFDWVCLQVDDEQWCWELGREILSGGPPIF